MSMMQQTVDGTEEPVVIPTRNKSDEELTPKQRYDRERNQRQKRERDSRAGDTSPKRGRSSGRGVGVKLDTLRRRLRELLHTTGGLASAVDPYIGAVISERADSAADAYVKVAQENERVRRMLDGLTQGGVYGAAVMVTVSMAAPIAARIGLLPEPFASQAHLLWGPKTLPIPMAPTGEPVGNGADRRGKVQPDTSPDGSTPRDPFGGGAG